MTNFGLVLDALTVPVSVSKKVLFPAHQGDDALADLEPLVDWRDGYHHVPSLELASPRGEPFREKQVSRRVNRRLHGGSSALNTSVRRREKEKRGDGQAVTKKQERKTGQMGQERKGKGEGQDDLVTRGVRNGVDKKGEGHIVTL